MARGRFSEDWTSRGLIRRDFRQDHGGGPEVAPHRKKSKGKPRKRIDHKHEYVEEYVEVWYRETPELYLICKICRHSDWRRAWYLRKLRKK